jgi:ABC-type multidrug transport system fused ATPase/permease subunit
MSLGPLHAETSLGVLLAAGVAFALLRLGLQAPVSLTPAKIVRDTQARLRAELFGAFTRASWGEQSRDREGHLQELVTNQLVQASTGIIQAAAFVVAALSFLVLVLSALVLNVLAAVAVLAAALALFAALRPFNNLAARHARALSHQYLGYAGGVNEAVRLAEEAHVFGAGAAQREHSNVLFGRVSHSVFYNLLLGRLVPGVYQSLIYLLVVGGLGALYAAGGTQVASLSAVVLILVRAGTYGQQLQASYVAVRQALPYMDRLEEARRRYAASAPPPGDLYLGRVRAIAFRDVGFAYEPGRPVVSGIDFEVAGGEAVGIVGPSGAGKSTLVQLLLALRAPQSGQYLVNGVPAERFTRNDWHARFAYVPQEPRLLHASVAENIRFFRDLDDAAVERAARLAAIHDDVMTWVAGYDTVVGPRADAVSGGQQQRICLARALAGSPDVLVLDEPTSALDFRSEALIGESLAALKGSLTLFVVAHRLSTLDICERVMVVVGGKLDAFADVATLALDSTYFRSVAEMLPSAS